MLKAVVLNRTWVQQYTDWSTDFTAQWRNRNLSTTYLYTKLASVVTVGMLLSVVFLQQAPLSKMRAVFLKHTHCLSVVMIHGKASIWRNTAEGRVSCGWMVSGLWWIPEKNCMRWDSRGGSKNGSDRFIRKWEMMIERVFSRYNSDTSHVSAYCTVVVGLSHYTTNQGPCCYPRPGIKHS